MSNTPQTEADVERERVALDARIEEVQTMIELLEDERDRLRARRGRLDTEDAPADSPRAVLLHALSEMEAGDWAAGVPVSTLLGRMRAFGFDKPEAAEVINDLKRRGEVYVVEGRVKRT